MGNTRKGKFIVIEGTDGSGKSEQVKRLISRIRNTGLEVETFDFPQYGQPSAYFAEEYLNGRYGTWEEVGPKKAALFFALDRFSAKRKIALAVESGKIVVANRYAASNMGHQGAKIASDREREEFFRWDYELEYGLLGIPKPDLNIVLRVPADTAQKLVDKKGGREYLKGTKRDIHESDIRHLEQAEAAYLQITRFFSNDFVLVECVDGERLLSIDEIHERVWRVVQPLLSIMN